jgi:hypothetical protein
MVYTLVNKNLLVPRTEVYTDFNTSIQQMLDTGNGRDKKYCSNLYVVSEDYIYFTNGQYVYSVSNSNTVQKVNVKLPTNSQLKIMNSFLTLKTNNSSSNTGEENYFSNSELNTGISEINDMDIEFDVNSKNKITIIDNVTQSDNSKKNKVEKIIEPKVKSKEELELLKLCEETMELYQTEVRKMKEIEQKIKVLDNNKKMLLKKQKEKMLGNFSKFKNDFTSFKLINKKLEKKPDMEIPSLFAPRYNYFLNLIQNQENLALLNLVEDLNLDEVLNNDVDLDPQLTHFVNEYGENSSKLNVKFDHSWEDLELETDAMEMNNSRLSAVN